MLHEQGYDDPEVGSNTILGFPLLQAEIYFAPGISEL